MEIKVTENLVFQLQTVKASLQRLISEKDQSILEEEQNLLSQQNDQHFAEIFSKRYESRRKSELFKSLPKAVDSNRKSNDKEMKLIFKSKIENLKKSSSKKLNPFKIDENQTNNKVPNENNNESSNPNFDEKNFMTEKEFSEYKVSSKDLSSLSKKRTIRQISRIKNPTRDNKIHALRAFKGFKKEESSSLVKKKKKSQTKEGETNLEKFSSPMTFKESVNKNKKGNYENRSFQNLLYLINIINRTFFTLTY